MRISSLRQVPQFADTIAHRGWSAFDSGLTLAEYRAGLEPLMKSEGVPSALVAHDKEKYLGSVLVIANDLDARPDLTPWIAALWVEPNHRAGVKRCYLCATRENSPYYLARGFNLIEEDVTGLSVFDISTKL
jgi:hypothetical protein